MPNFTIPSSPSSFDTVIKMLEPEDPNSNTLFNGLFQQLIHNESYLLNNKIGYNDTSAAAWRLRGTDTRSSSATPAEYMAKGSMNLYIEFKYSSALSLNIAGGSNGYVLCLTFVPWGDGSGGRPVQIAVCTIGIYARPASSDTDWGSWKTIVTF